MKVAICVGCVMLVGCSEKAEVALKVFKTKAENRLVSAAGESEVLLALYQNQYAALKERLIRLKVAQKLCIENVDQAYTNPDDLKKINMYEGHLTVLNQKIPDAEAALQQFYDLYENQKVQLKLLKEELATYQLMGGLPTDMDIYSGCEKRAATIKDLNERLKEKLAKAKVTLEVNKFEETFIR